MSILRQLLFCIDIDFKVFLKVVALGSDTSLNCRVSRVYPKDQTKFRMDSKAGI
jgi:hypothetical protein